MSITDAELRRKKACGYLSPGGRDGCHRCFYLTVTTQQITRCVKHRMQVAKAGICPEFFKVEQRDNSNRTEER